MHYCEIWSERNAATNKFVSNKKPLILAVTGPTAAGKTDLAIQLSQKFPIELINMDSAQIYRDMDIGTAKISEQEH